MRVLILGSGGRENAITNQMLNDDKVEKIFNVPGNGGTGVGKSTNVEMGYSVSDFENLASWAVKERIDLVVPGPEVPLVDGIETVFRKGTKKFLLQLEFLALGLLKWQHD